MPQNNTDIINSKEFQDFVKDNNLFPQSWESYALIAFQQNSIINKQQAYIAELGKHTHVTKYEDWIYKDETLFDRWSNQ